MASPHIPAVPPLQGRGPTVPSQVLFSPLGEVRSLRMGVSVRCPLHRTPACRWASGTSTSQTSRQTKQPESPQFSRQKASAA